MKKIAVIMLAAGASKRMGKPKQLMPWGEKLLLNHCLEEACKCNALQVYLVLGAYADDIIPQLSFCGKILLNPRWQEGLACSVKEGVQKAIDEQMDAVLMLVADQPFVHAGYLNRMIDLYQLEEYPLMATEYPDKAGVPALFDKQLFPQLLALTGDRGAQSVINAHKDIRQTIAPDFPLTDLDFPTDFKLM